MGISIGLIKWPASRKSSVWLYLGFLLRVTEMMGLDFSDFDNDPVTLTRGYLDGVVTEEERALALSRWWGCLGDGEIRNFNDKSVLMTRLAICFLSINEENSDEIGEHLSWFIEVLGFLGCDLSEVIGFMGEYFEF